MKPSSSVVFVLALALAGCMKPNPLLYTLGQESTDSESGDGDGDPGDGDPGDGDPGDGETEAAPMDMPDDPMCEPVEPFEATCGECLALDCCDVTLACAEVDQCPCLADCLLRGGKNSECKNACDGVKPGDVDELQPLISCAQDSCESQCVSE